MILKVSSIRDQGNLSNERIVIKVDGKTDIGEYLLLCASFKNGAFTNVVYQTYWFPDKIIGPGDLVVLYTKRGSSNEKVIKSGKAHFFYWGKSRAIWSQPNRAPVLIYADDWQGFPLEEIQK
jgi:hypothetical protein